MYNRKKFFDGFRLFLKKRKKVLTQDRVKALEFLLSEFEEDARWNDLRHVAYALATITIETAWTFEPIQEYGTKAYFERRYGYKTRKGKELGNDAEGEGAKYSGKGYVQLTGETNYERLEAAIRKQYSALVKGYKLRTGEEFDLTDFAYQAKDPEIAFAIMTIGMFQGIYTGKKITDYINSAKTDYKNARKVINGLDRATEIAGYAKEFENILKTSKESEQSTSLLGSNTIFDNPEEVEELEESAVSDAELAKHIEERASGENGVAVEVEKVETVKTEEGVVSQTIEQKNVQDVSIPAAVAGPRDYNGIGFWPTIRKDLIAVTGGNLTFQGVTEYVQQASGWPEWVISFITKAAFILTIATVAYVLFRIGHYLIFRWKESHRIKFEATLMTDTSRKDIEWV